MKRTLMQVYVKGSIQAVELYQKAFCTVLGDHVKNAAGTYYHSELDVYGQIISVAERTDDLTMVTGNTMQFCLQFNEQEISAVEQAYEVLKENAEILVPLGPCDYSSLMTDLVDQFGVRWCLFVS